MDLNSVKSQFSIKDLENFSGIKAHTIRAWERRYEILSPDRTDGNQRTYDLTDLQKLLNIKLLYDNGVKISKIAALTEEELPKHVFGLVSEMHDSHQAVDMLKMAMLEFDQSKFEKTYLHLVSNLSFRRVFLDVFLPLLEQIGYLWQLDAITPAHEHFVSNLIQQKILVNIERIQTIQFHRSDKVFVLYLPYGEIHDLGLLYLHYELILRGYKSIYLGHSVPIDSLVLMHELFDTITFCSYFTVCPPIDEIPGYIEKVEEMLTINNKNSFWVSGRLAAHVKFQEKSDRLHAFGKLEDVLKKLTE